MFLLFAPKCGQPPGKFKSMVLLNKAKVEGNIEYTCGKTVQKRGSENGGVVKEPM